MDLDKDAIKEMITQIQTADLIERLQTQQLISPDERNTYFARLNDRVHTTLDLLLPAGP